MTDKIKTAAFVAATANVPAIIPAYENAEFVAKLVDKNTTARERENALLALSFGEVAMLGAMFVNAAESANKVMAMKLTSKHGEGWADRKFAGLGRPLTDLEKADRDAINADIEIMRSALKAKGHTNPSQAIGYVKQWAQGTRGKPRDANVNKARPTMQYIKEDWPAIYKKLHNAEDLEGEAVLVAYDAIGNVLKSLGVDLHALVANTK
jgi:hypothetical protein